MKIELLMVALTMMALGAIVQAAPRPGLDLDKEKEKKLADATGAILDTLAATKPDYRAIVRRIREARGVAGELLAMVGVPHAAASMADIPQPSFGDVRTWTQLPLKSSIFSASSTYPRKRTVSPRPNRDARAFRLRS